MGLPPRSTCQKLPSLTYCFYVMIISAGQPKLCGQLSSAYKVLYMKQVKLFEASLSAFFYYFDGSQLGLAKIWHVRLSAGRWIWCMPNKVIKWTNYLVESNKNSCVFAYLVIICIKFIISQNNRPNDMLFDILHCPYKNQRESRN